MPPRIRRRTVAVDDATPTPTQTQTPDGEGDVDMDASQHNGSGSGSIEQLAKSLVRYALSCEYARKPIKRQDVNERGGHGGMGWAVQTQLTPAVLGTHARLFRPVFEQANSELMDVFGMAMAELPKAERVTARQKRGASGVC
ncbi:uncharacterized protein EKO05_0003272 [Ascochyta rabiei]|uniref:uncharacterized protein n=1 Tax=Didymella rabiei TaxID=5454 RepID=UPI002209F30B|nr:uncharacterized protein EKO05_0003272 [Ascochyta rabiei]UPX12734.1 hypothetical protein EKO05_0003272 [Ascochyta rabiei]